MNANVDFQSPKRHQILPKAFSVTPTHTPLCDVRVFPWSEGRTREGDLSPSDSCIGDSPRTPDCGEREAALRRGRPRADSIGSLIIEGSKTPGTIRCKVCNRNFPRGKSLQAHMRTHTGKQTLQNINNPIKLGNCHCSIHTMDLVDWHLNGTKLICRLN